MGLSCKPTGKLKSFFQKQENLEKKRFEEAKKAKSQPVVSTAVDS